MALPLTVGAGSPFPERDLILFLAFAVIFSTLVVQGLSLSAVIRFLRIAEDGAEAKEELRARLEATRAALTQIEVLAEQRTVVVRMRNRGEISSEVMIRVIRDFDLEESRLEI